MDNFTISQPQVIHLFPSVQNCSDQIFEKHSRLTNIPMMHSELESLPEKEDSKHIRTSQELKIIEEQVHAPTTKVKYWTLFRYATTSDLLCLLVGSLSSIAGGSALPLMAVRYSNHFTTVVDLKLT